MRDLIIIGGGPAGLTAGIYGKRAGLDTLVIESMPLFGGQVTTTVDVDNYPGLPGIGGFELGDTFKRHADKFGVEFLEGEVMGIEAEGEVKSVTVNGEKVEGRALIIATGAAHNQLGVPGEEELRGMGVSYCATCDGAFFRKRVTVVVGGGDVALEDALFLARGCEKVYLIHRRDTYRAAYSIVEKVKNTENIIPVYNSVVDEILGDGQVSGVRVTDKKSGESSVIECAGVFIAVGTHPITEFVKGSVDMDEKGYIIAGEDCRTNVDGVYAAGDVRVKPLRQIVTATADGANAVNSAVEYLS
ncbi:MAG: thioredoxin-disulfide reductase [Lachnospiraceae bacterium]|nr:thioredoxin-disulfide reductase [Lachnospiraceae bacterium]